MKCGSKSNGRYAKTKELMNGTMQKKYKCAIFDLDGTLIDSMWLWEAVDREFFEKRGIPYPEDYMTIVATMGVDKMARYTIERFGLADSPDEVIAEWRAMSEEAYRTKIHLKPGARAFLEYLRENGIPMALASVSPRHQVEAALTSNGIGSYFSEVATVEDVSRPKGFPDIYEFVAKKLGFAPADCLVFEDLAVAIEGARMGGFSAVAVTDPASASEEDRKRELSLCMVDRLDEVIAMNLF